MADSRYGLDLGNILSQASNIKSARLTIQQKEKELDRQDAGEKLRANVFSEDLPQEEVERLSVLAPKVAKDIKATQQKTAQVESLTNYYMKRGLPKKEASLRATGYAKDIDTFNKEYRTKTKFEQEQVRTSISQQGQAIQSMLKVAQKNPQQANQMYQDYLANKNEQIKKLLREGQTEIADKLQESIDKAPPSLIKPDGTFDAEFPMMSLSKMSTMMANAETWDAQAKSDIKMEEAKAKEQLRQQRPDTKSGEYERILKRRDALLRKQETSELSKIEQGTLSSLESKLLKEESPAMDAVAKRWEFRDKKVASFSAYLPEEFKDVALVDLDTRKFTKAQKSKADSTANAIIQAENPQGSKKAIDDTRKSLVAVNQLSQALKQTEQISKSGKNINIVDKTIRDNFSQYFGMSDQEMQTAFRDKRYASASNMIRNALFGSAVSKQENKNFVDATASLYGTNKSIVLGMKSMLEDVKAKLEINAEIVPAAAFNLKFGDRVSNLNDMIDSIDNIIEGKKPSGADDLARLRASKTQAKQVIERRTAPDGRTIVKYSDNTHGVE